MKKKIVTKVTTAAVAGTMLVSTGAAPVQMAVQAADNGTVSAQAESSQQANNFKEAKADLKEAEEAKKKAAEAEETAKTALEEAKQEKAGKEKEAETAKEKLDTANAEKAKKDAVVEEKEQAVRDAKAAVKKAQDAYDHPDVQLKEAREKKAAAEAAVSQAETDLKTAQTEKEQAEKEAETAKETVSSAQTKVDKAQKAYDAATDDSSAKSQGSLGFFAYIGDTDAVDVFSSSDFTEGLKYTTIGAEGDATSLENMKKSLDYLAECNDLLVNVQKTSIWDSDTKLIPLTVTSYMMATSQINANWSNYHLGHSSEGIFGENIAYGPADPYQSWYYDELEIWNQMLEEVGGDSSQISDISEVGHLENLCGSSGGSTGFGLCTKRGDGANRYGNTYCQQFGGLDGCKEYSLEEYTSLFNQYYEKVMAESKDKETAKKELDDAKAELETAQKELSEKNALVEQAEKKVSEKQAAKDQADQELASAEKELAALENGDQAKENLEKAKVALTQAEEELKSAKEDAEKAQEKVAEAQNAYDVAKKAADAVDLTEKENALKEATKTREQADADVQYAQTVYDQMLEEAKSTLRAVFDWDGAKDKNGKITASTVNVTNIHTKNGDTFADTKAEIAKSSEVAATCTEEGKTIYTATVTVQDEDGTEIGTVTGSYVEKTDATGHDYGEPVWSDWKEEHGKWTCSATFTCKHDNSHILTPEVKVSAESKDATCTTAGTVTYTASVEVNGKTYTKPDTKTTQGALGHDLEANWNWKKTKDGYEASVTATCSKGDFEGTGKAAATLDKSQSVAPTYSAEGKDVYVAEVTVKDADGKEGGTVTGTYTETVAKLTNPFRDVHDGDWYKDSVMWALDQKVTTGKTANTFGSNDTCTRAEAVTFLWRAAGSPDVSGETGFSDVKADAYYAKAVIWAAQNGITTGMGDGTFRPNQSCSRAEIVTFLWRMEGKESSQVKDISFEDVNEYEFYYDAVLWAVDHGITTGQTEEKFAPSKTCTRSEIVTFLYREFE